MDINDMTWYQLRESNMAARINGSTRVNLFRLSSFCVTDGDHRIQIYISRKHGQLDQMETAGRKLRKNKISTYVGYFNDWYFYIVFSYLLRV